MAPTQYSKFTPAYVRRNNLALQITPNYNIRLTQAEIREQLPNINFEGPGWYFIKHPSGTKIDSILIVADMTRPKRIWKKQGWYHKCKFVVFIWENYDANITNMLLNQAPVRIDERE